IDGNIDVGDNITANNPIQVHLLTGDVCATFESRFFTLKPEEQWSNNYYNPVSTPNDNSASTGTGNHPTYVFLYNHNGAAINVTWETNGGVQGTLSVPSGGTNFVQLPNGTGTRFYSTGGENFYAIATIDSDPDGSSNNSGHDWGFALIPGDQLTSQITMVGFAPGQDPTYCASNNDIAKGAWSLQSVSSEETSAGTFTATNAFDNDNNTFWHTAYSGGSVPTHPHELQIDMGASYEVNGFRYLPRATYNTTTYPSTNIPQTIPAGGTVSSTITVPSGGTITDLNVLNLDIDHTYTGYILVTLTSPAGTTVTLMNSPCSFEDDIEVNFDESAATFTLPCPAVGFGTYLPWGYLTDFNGEDAAGTWTLTVSEPYGSRGGTIEAWSLELTTGAVQNGAIADFDFY
ncbi:MAG: proprotein convertase P-domain-containing protein, partial [Bacteroidota bacterium]